MSDTINEQQEINGIQELEKSNQDSEIKEKAKILPDPAEEKIIPADEKTDALSNPTPTKLTKGPPVVKATNHNEQPETEQKDVQDDEKPAEFKSKSKDRVTYTIEELFKINEKKGTTRRHNSLLDKYFKTNESGDEKQRSRWDPEAWHKSEDSRSASPQVDGWNDAIQLAPKRGSFEQGCHVKTVADVNEKLASDRSRRLTNRAASHRTIHESNYKDADSISVKSNEFEAHRKGQSYQSRDRTYSNDRNDHNKKHISKYDHEKKKEYDNTPEWMSDAPMISDDFNFFNSKIEEEKKAYAQSKKRVKISPVIETQIFKKDRKSRTPSPQVAGGGNTKDFDLNKFMKDVEYYPPQLFKEDPAGTKSRFTQYFQFKEREGNVPNGPIIPDEVISGPSPVSPNIPQQFFAPIQPAPVLLNAAANAHAQQSSNIATIIEKTRQEKLLENLSKAKHEVRGSLSLAEIEGRVKPLVPNGVPKNQEASYDNSAFNSLLQSMKNAGQLPEKPSPIVTGLPAHLLPQPPSRTSPVFEKLKRTLSRSPSPKDFAQAVSTVASIISTHPSINQELAILKTASAPTAFVPDENPRSGITPVQTPKSQPIKSLMHSSTAGSSAKKPTNAFTPTSVLKKMHKGKMDDGESSHPDVSNVNFQSNGKYPDILPDQAKQQNKNNEKINLNSQFLEAAVTPDRFKWNNDPEVSNLMPFHSAPVTPKNHFPIVSQSSIVSASAPGTPARNEIIPPMVKRVTVSSLENKDTVLLAPSAFKTVNGSNSSSRSDLGVIGSGLRQDNCTDRSAYNKFVDQIGKIQLGERTSPRQLPADPKLAPGNRSFDLRNIENQMQENVSRTSPVPQPQSQQQQLLQNQRMATIQQAQLLQQQKLQEIAKLGKQSTSRINEPLRGQPSNISQLLPDQERNEHQPMQSGTRRSPYLQQQQQQQYLNYQQQQQQHLLNQHRAHMNHQHMHLQGYPPRLPLNHMQPQYPGMQPPPRPFNHVNFAAQALVQQQLINQAARARLIAQAQAQAQLLQQPQVVQAALMAQAALVRGQAQAQAAMMLNPRNIQAMAEHMGLRQPFNPVKHVGRRQGSNASTPTSHSPEEPENGDDKGILSKWFSNDILKQMPTKTGPENHNLPNKAKFMSVEELERSQK